MRVAGAEESVGDRAEEGPELEEDTQRPLGAQNPPDESYSAAGTQVTPSA